MHKVWSWGSVLLVGLALGVAALWRWGRRAGATVEEAQRVLPGDELVPQPRLQTTHAITIQAPPAAIWPWVVQLGYYRGGWHTDTAWWDFLPDRYLRGLVRREEARTGVRHRDAPTDRRILPEFQQLAVGDVILDGPPGTAYFTVAALEPYRLLALYSTSHVRYLFPAALRDDPRWGIGGEFTWNFVLEETPGGGTRLFLRTRGDVRPGWYRTGMAALLPLVDWALAGKLLRGVRAAAESGR